MPHQQLLGLLVAELLPQRGKEVSQLSRADEPVAVLVEMPQSLNEVIASISGSPGADRLHDRKKLLEGDSIICSVLNHQLLDFALGRILNHRQKLE